MLKVKVFRGTDQWSPLEITKEEPGQIPEGVAPHIIIRSHEHLEKQINDWIKQNPTNLQKTSIINVQYRAFTREGNQGIEGIDSAFILYDDVGY